MKKVIEQELMYLESLEHPLDRRRHLESIKAKLLEEAFIDPIELEKCLKNYPDEIKEMLWTAYNEGLFEEMKKDLVPDVPEAKTNEPQKERTNQLHQLIDKADICLSKEIKGKPKQIEVFYYLKRNQRELDTEQILQEFDERIISWISFRGVEQKMAYQSFCKTLSNLRKNRKLPLPQ